MFQRTIPRRLFLAMWFASFALVLRAADKAEKFDPRLGAPFEARDRPRLGSDQAPIVVVEFGSYKCSHCEEFLKRVFPELTEKYIKPGKVQWFMVPSSDNPADQSSRIFALGRCVARQGKFWETLGPLMSLSNKPPSFLVELVSKSAGIDAAELDVCLQQRDTRVLVAKDFDEYHLLGVLGTPTFVVRKLKADGTRTEAIVRGYQPAEYFQRLFDELAKTP